MEGRPALHPFNARIGMPLAAKAFGGFWGFVVLSRLCIVLGMAVLWMILGHFGVPMERRVLGVCIFMLHPYLFAYLWRYPILTDQAAGLLLIASWYAALNQWTVVWLVLFMVGALVREWNIPAAASLAVFHIHPFPIAWSVVSATAVYWLICKTAPAKQPEPDDMRFAPILQRIRYYAPANWFHILNLLDTWKIVGVMAMLGSLQACPDLLRATILVPVCMTQGLWANNIFRFHLHSWPVVIALAVCI